MRNKYLKILLPMLAMIICILILLLWHQRETKEIDQANFLVSVHKTMVDQVYIHLTIFDMDHNREFPQEPHNYVRGFSPKHSIKMDEYLGTLNSINPAGRGINIAISLGNLDLSHGACFDFILKSRVKLILNGVLISNDSLATGIARVGGMACHEGDFFFSWAPDLVPGDHQVIFLLTDDNGVVWEKSWEFQLLP